MEGAGRADAGCLENLGPDGMVLPCGFGGVLVGVDRIEGSLIAVMFIGFDVAVGDFHY